MKIEEKNWYKIVLKNQIELKVFVEKIDKQYIYYYVDYGYGVIDKRDIELFKKLVRVE